MPNGECLGKARFDHERTAHTEAVIDSAIERGPPAYATSGMPRRASSSSLNLLIP